MSVPLFNGGRNLANLELSEKQRDIAVDLYTQAVQIAFREAADQLAVYGTLDQQLKTQQSLTEAASKSYTRAGAVQRRDR